MARDDSRRLPRIPAEHVALIRSIDAAGLEDFAKTRNVGLGGCSFLTDEAPAVGETVEVLISVDQRVITTRGRVVHRREEDDRHLVGVEFLDVGREDAVVLRELMQNGGE